MMVIFDNARVYYLNPEEQLAQEKDWSNIAWIEFEQ
jgi:hypothetical protein